jgi:eukaryotic-like serine/threonine-protein kinase
MALVAGARFGPYEAIEQIGSGGMGQVWRARDKNLKRDVAVKVLPESFAADADRLARFQREAEILAALNHPNIATIHGLEQADGQTLIVMELVEGPTLADRIAEGPLSPDEVMRIAVQIVAALEAAHNKQIVHRDLKPANVKLRDDGTVKVLDFGISKPIDANAISGGSPVMTTPAMTQTGVILGTAAYMSPEQARGKFVDERTDIWAFGCLLFEMLTGQPAFAGEDVMATLARVIDRDTDLSSIPGTISPAVRHTIQLCLEKNPDKRISDIRDVRLALAGTFEQWPRDAAASDGIRPSRSPWPIAAAAVLAAIIGSAAVWFLKAAPPPAPQIITRFDHELPDGISLRNAITSVLDIAPNGEFFVYNGSDGIHVRAMAETEDRVIPGTDTPVADVVVAPNGRELAYFRQGNQGLELAKIAINGGAPIALAAPLDDPFGISWESDGTILFGQPDGIWRVSENGGTPVRVIETEDGEQAYGPQLLPGGEWVLFTLARTTGPTRWNTAEIVVESLTSGERRLLRAGGNDARYLPTGHLTYVFENVLFASAFDATTLTLEDERVSLIQGVQTANAPGLIGGSGFYAVSNSGTLIYVPGTAGPAPVRPERSLVWVDRLGNTEPLPLRPDDYTTARISPDGTKVAVVVGSAIPRTDPAPDIYIFDLETENLSQLTFDPESDDTPLWSPDGSLIYFRSYRDDSDGGIYVIPAGGGDAKLLAKSEASANPTPWGISADSAILLGTEASNATDADIVMLELGTSDKLVPLIEDNQISVEPALSPNGEWMVYYHRADDSPAEINIRPFPDVRQQRRPVAEGLNPVFSADGSELFFLDGAGLSVVSVEYAPFRVGNREALFRGQYWYGVVGPSGAFGRAWDVDPSGDRFLMITMPGGGIEGGGEQARPQINVVLNWFDELERRVPVAVR